VPERQYRFPVVSAEVVDGDTYRMVIDLGVRVKIEVEVRLDGWDCPETRSRGGRVVGPRERLAGKAAKDLAHQWLEGHLAMGHAVWLATEEDPEKYGRWLGHVTATAKGETPHDLGEALEAVDLATPWPTRWFTTHPEAPTPGGTPRAAHGPDGTQDGFPTAPEPGAERVSSLGTPHAPGGTPDGTQDGFPTPPEPPGTATLAVGEYVIRAPRPDGTQDGFPTAPKPPTQDDVAPARSAHGQECCADCDQPRSAPGVEAICAAWHRPGPEASPNSLLAERIAARRAAHGSPEIPQKPRSGRDGFPTHP
jgi:hypothetical protein